MLYPRKEVFTLTKSCRLCPHSCGTDRTKTPGRCGCLSEIKAARASLHHWEEPCLSGTNGSGTVFFSGCTLSCVYCQNSEISHKSTGKIISAQRLAEIFIELQNLGAHNINLVTPDHFADKIADAIMIARLKNFTLPVVYNTSGYCSIDTLKMFDGLVDIYLPDFKYMSSEISKKYSFAENYPETAKAAINEMHRQQPVCQFDENGIMTKGVIVRHMILPGFLYDSKEVVKYLYKTYKNNLYISIMNQYTPHGDLKKYPEICRSVSKREYDALVDFAINLGVENAFIQSGTAADESFIPHFDCRGI